MDREYKVNKGKSEEVEYCGKHFLCYAVQTEVIMPGDALCDVAERYLKSAVTDGDTVFMSEKMVAVTEGRAYPVNEICAGRLARFLCRFVKKSPYGIGLAMPETMQCALNEVGIPRILIACIAAAAGRVLRRKGWFYKVAGRKAAAIDGPCSYTIPPYNKYVVLSPENPDKSALEVSKRLGGCTVLIIDANDFGCEILGSSDRSIDVKMYKSLLRQNPLGQSTQSTPMGILRPVGEK